ncbi:MAG: YajQ family cyclic di-GMP-binding protein [Candidatus Sericytochromatia bacterium]|uniref:Nucleotide-binding protein FJZ00_04815 n=1 Tax=Candidatus Tanganyikabacteria bacterium TaxID=2961651 RepID=A0A937X1Y5_9BACT|nr:YajQ family cyclic di-GMP-binding protein [Candidatus Tanganyikabacteria bacterium]
MAKECSFDVVSQVDMAEVQNALNMASKEIEQRFDLKGSGSKLELGKDGLVATAPDEMKLKNILDIFQDKMARRNVPLKALDFGKIEQALAGTVRQTVGIRQGIDRDNARKIVDLIKGTKLKVQAQIQDDQVRVAAKSKDDLQTVMTKLRQAELPLALQFTNYRD